MTTFYYLVAAILTSQPSVGFKGFDASAIGKYTTQAACQAAIPSIEGLATDALPTSTIVNSNNHAFCVAAPSVSGGVSYTMVAQTWAGGNNSARNTDRFTIAGFASFAACEAAGDVVEIGIESHYAIASVPTVFANTACVKVQ